MPVGHEHIADPLKFARRKRCQVSGVEQHGSAPKAEVQEQAGVAERLVHEPGLDKAAHFKSARQNGSWASASGRLLILTFGNGVDPSRFIRRRA